MNRVVLAALAVLVAAACGEKAPPMNPEPPPVAADAAPVLACAAAEGQCCMPDGTIVVPGGCQPHFPDDVQPNVERADDGSCREIPCTLRCLPATAAIATPVGDVEVSRLQVGDPIWTVDAAGRRVAGHVARVSSRPVVEAHAIVEHTLADGRIVRASAGHPDAHGVAIGALVVGAAIDGSTIVATRVVPYSGSHTWDVRADGATGAYWSDGVLLGSTLEAP